MSQKSPHPPTPLRKRFQYFFIFLFPFFFWVAPRLDQVAQQRTVSLTALLSRARRPPHSAACTPRSWPSPAHSSRGPAAKEPGASLPLWALGLCCRRRTAWREERALQAGTQRTQGNSSSRQQQPATQPCNAGAGHARLSSPKLPAVLAAGAGACRRAVRLLGGSAIVTVATLLVFLVPLICASYPACAACSLPCLPLMLTPWLRLLIAILTLVFEPGSCLGCTP